MKNTFAFLLYWVVIQAIVYILLFIYIGWETALFVFVAHWLINIYLKKP